jgi:hypothetical protein
MTLTSPGWDESFAEAFEPHLHNGLVPARIALEQARLRRPLGGWRVHGVEKAAQGPPQARASRPGRVEGRSRKLLTYQQQLA